MKFPSLLRTPKHKRFNYEPRHYDPIKEDIQNRTERIKGELKNTSFQSHSDHIKIAFRKRAKRDKSSDFMQLLLVVIMFGTFGGWLIYGNIILYISMVVFPLYIFFRTRKFFQ
jgi:hypothetical protein